VIELGVDVRRGRRRFYRRRFLLAEQCTFHTASHMPVPIIRVESGGSTPLNPSPTPAFHNVVASSTCVARHGYPTATGWYKRRCGVLHPPRWAFVTYSTPSQYLLAPDSRKAAKSLWVTASASSNPPSRASPTAPARLPTIHSTCPRTAWGSGWSARTPTR
jgi:hypothetical protein